MKTQRAEYGETMGQLTEAIVSAMDASGESQYAIAKGAGVSRSQLSRMTRGESGMTADTIERLAEYLGLEIVVRPKQDARRSK